MSLRRFLPFFLSAVLSGTVLFAGVTALATDFTGNYTIVGNGTTGYANVSTFITSFPPSNIQNIPLANATITNATFVVVASGTNWSNTTNTNITGNVDSNGNLTVTGPRGSTGVGTVNGLTFNLTCAYKVPQGSRIIYNYNFGLVPAP